MINLSREQFHAFTLLKKALEDATTTALFDTLAIYVHPNVINDFCDAVKSMDDDRLISA